MIDENQLDDLLDRWEAARELGQALDLLELCAACPELLPAVQQQIAALEQIDMLLGGTASAGWTFGDTSDGVIGEALQQMTVPPTIGRYRLDQLLGEGGFGRVWRAFDPSLDRPVALKILRGSRTRWPRQVEQFLDEARKLARLRHSHIVPVYDVGRDGPHVYLVSAIVEGENLASRLARGQLSVDAAVTLTATVADALEHAHQCGMVHRDIKPANILLDQFGQPFITDFGIAISSAETPDGLLGSAGTPRYMAPEQISAAAADRRSDVYSLGVIFYEMLTGRAPRSPNPISPRAMNPAVPEAVANLCLKAIERDPSRRPATAAQFAECLRATLNAASPAQPERLLIRRVGLGVALASAAVLMAISAVLFLRRPIPPEAAEPAALAAENRWHRGPNATAILRGHRAGVCSLALSRDGRQILSGAWDGTARLWDIETRQELAELSVEQPVVFATAFSPDKTQGLFGGKNSAVKVWNLAEKTEIGELVGHTAGEFVLAVQWLADGRRALSASGDWTVRLWDLPSTRETKVFKTGSGWAWSLAISPDEKLVAAGANGAVIVWSLDSGEELHRFTGHAGAVDAVAFSRDGNRIVSGGEDRTCRVWDLASGQQLSCLAGHTDRVRGVAWLSGGKTVVSISEDHTARLWDVTTGHEVFRYVDSPSNLNALVVLPNGTEFAAACNDGAIRIWPLDFATSHGRDGKSEK